MRTALMLLALLAAPAFAAETVWKWVDERGIVHYSDQPVPGAQRVDISTGSRSQSSSSPAPATSQPGSRTSRPTTASYTNFEIWKPSAQETIVNTGGVVEVALRFDPELVQGHSVVLYLDNRLVADFPSRAREHTLRDVPRGQHSLVAIIRDGRGTQLQETAPVSFTVRQESIAQPPVGPALRPPPKPRAQSGNKLQTTQPSYAALNGARPKIDPRTNKPAR